MQIEKVESTLNGNPIKCGHFNSSMYDSYIEFPVNLDTGKKYTIHGYIKSSVAGQISCEDATSNVSTEWSHVVMTITPSQQKSLELKFYPGEFWIYEWKLEVGEVNSNWTPSPLDAKYDLISLGSEVQQLSNSITQKVWKEDINEATKEINKSVTTVSQDAEKIYWLIDKNSENQASMTLTSDLYKLVAENINLTGKVTFESFSSAMQDNWNGLSNTVNTANKNAVTAWNTTQDIIKNIYVTNKTTINGGRIETGTVTADAIATDAIVSKNYVKDSTGSFLNLADGTFDSKYLKWNSTGAITATSGNIGGLSLKDGVLSSQTETYLLPDRDVLFTIREAILANWTEPSADLPLNLYDFNTDGKVDLVDFARAKRYLLGKTSEEDFEKWKYAKKSSVVFEINPQNAKKAVFLSAEDMWGKERKTQIGIGNIYSNEIECINLKIKDPISHNAYGSDNYPIENLNYRDTSTNTNIDLFNRSYKISGNGMLIVNCSIWTDETSDYGTTSCAIYIDEYCVNANRHRTDSENAVELDAGSCFTWWFCDDTEHTLRIIAGSTKTGTKTYTQSIQALFGLTVS